VLPSESGRSHARHRRHFHDLAVGRRRSRRRIQGGGVGYLPESVRGDEMLAGGDGIVSALEWRVDKFNRRNLIPCGLLVYWTEPILSDAQPTAVFRIVQVSHADGTSTDVALILNSLRLELHVCDDGRRFDQQATSCDYSYGLLGSSGWARLIGASLSIDSVPGVDTTVTIHVPFGGGS
jgi:signal transduction histidine kinase